MTWFDKVTAQVERDTVSPEGKRITTMVVSFPRYIQAEVNTHRDFARSSGSSRAVPAARLYKEISASPWVPLVAANQKGMSAAERLDDEAQLEFRYRWLEVGEHAMRICEELGATVHKQWVNRLIEPWMYQRVIITSTNWANFFYQRIDGGAQPEMQVLAMRMYMAYLASTPVESMWHTPFLYDHETAQLPLEWDVWEEDLPDLLKISIARCARVSYLNHEGTREDEKDIALFDKLTSQGSLAPGHWAPLEHCATQHGMGAFGHRVDNYIGWLSIRRWYHTRYCTGEPTMEDVARAIAERFPRGFEVLGQKIYFDHEVPAAP